MSTLCTSFRFILYIDIVADFLFSIDARVLYIIPHFNGKGLILQDFFLKSLRFASINVPASEWTFRFLSQYIPLIVQLTGILW